eukprot:NODE_2034_length_1318_cov_19.333333_g1849_i0.p1 GENE.NODE_2034_length_1318_cov_19.333333_g1849_i0~~NODE_2034_length_1318_cov_19.333333_g1849_i0.p1  ORF type:complete len:407 (-),score=72.12 NODE_2034_length_1318_cov_19.333333_g1849_i0:7-1227(-)
MNPYLFPGFQIPGFQGMQPLGFPAPPFPMQGLPSVIPQLPQMPQLPGLTYQIHSAPAVRLAPQRPTPTPVAPVAPKPVPTNTKPLHPGLADVDQKTLVWVGRIDPGVDDEVLSEILALCGPVDSWKRVADPTTNKWKKFGFCEFSSAEGALRAFRVLNDFQLGPTTLLLKIEPKVAAFLKEYQLKRKEFLASLPEEQLAELNSEAAPSTELCHFVQVDPSQQFTSVHEVFPAAADQRLRDLKALIGIKKLIAENPQKVPSVETVESAEASLTATERAASPKRKRSTSPEREVKRQAVSLKSEKPDAKVLIKKVPADRVELFNWNVKWHLLDDTALQHLRKWISKNSSQLLGEEEPAFVEMIVENLQQRAPPNKLLKELEPVMDTEAESFVVRLWRLLILETLRKEQ